MEMIGMKMNASRWKIDAFHIVWPNFISNSLFHVMNASEMQKIMISMKNDVHNKRIDVLKFMLSAEPKECNDNVRKEIAQRTLVLWCPWAPPLNNQNIGLCLARTMEANVSHANDIQSHKTEEKLPKLSDLMDSK